MKIEGIPWHAMESEAGAMGTLFRNLRRRDVSARRLGDLTVAAMSAFTRGKDRAEAVAKIVEGAIRSGALQSDEAADRYLAILPGDWGCFFAGMKHDSGLPTAFMKTYVEIESASKEADAALARRGFADTAAIVRNNTTLHSYWCDKSLRALAAAQTVADTLRPRLHAWLQLQLSVVAKSSVGDPDAMKAQELCGNYAELLAGDSVRPGARWFAAAKELTGAKSLSDLRRKLGRNHINPETLPSEATIKRWSSGNAFPQRTEICRTFIERLAESAHAHRPSVGVEQARAAFVQLYGAANRFDHVAGWSERLIGLDAAEWIRASYDAWCQRCRAT